MRVITNEKFIARNARIGRWASMAALIILGAGVYLTFAHPELVVWTFVALIVGFMLSQVGIYFSSRWAKPPRIDQQITKALKGLSREYTLYHYSTPASHLLVGPAGIFVFIPRYQRGKITYSKGKWRQHGGPFLWYLRLFAQEGIGRPDLEIEAETKAVRKALEAIFEDTDELPPITPILVFTNPQAEVDAENAPVPTLKIEDLKKFLKPFLKSRKLTAEQLKRIRNAFEASSEIEAEQA